MWEEETIIYIQHIFYTETMHVVIGREEQIKKDMGTK